MPLHFDAGSSARKREPAGQGAPCILLQGAAPRRTSSIHAGINARSFRRPLSQNNAQRAPGCVYERTLIGSARMGVRAVERLTASTHDESLMLDIGVGFGGIGPFNRQINKGEFKDARCRYGNLVLVPPGNQSHPRIRQDIFRRRGCSGKGCLRLG